MQPIDWAICGCGLMVNFIPTSNFKRDSRFFNHQSIQTMEIPKHIWSRWTDIYSRGDADKIAALADCHPNTVLNAIRNGRCKADLFEVMAKFYSERIALIEAIS
jgi:hypothetical protein